MRIPRPFREALKTGSMQINPAAFNIYWLLCELSLDNQHWLTVTLEEIGTILRMSNTTIQTGLRELQEEGLIEKKKISHRKRAYRVVG